MLIKVVRVFCGFVVWCFYNL